MGKSIFDEKKCPKICIKKAPKSTPKKTTFFDQKSVQNHHFRPSDRPRPLNTGIKSGFQTSQHRITDECDGSNVIKYKI